MPQPTPGLTPSPPSGPPPQGFDPMDFAGAFADQQATGPGGKPTTAVTGMYGPLSGSDRWRYATDQPGSEDMRNRQGAPITKSVQDLSRDFYTWDQKQKDQFRARLGLINKNALVASDSDLANTWADYVQQSANYFSAGIAMSPDDILNKDVATKGVGAPSLAGTRTSTTTDLNLTSKPDSDAIFNSAAKALLGRAPTEAEYAQFQSSLNSAERANPVQATTTTTTDAEGNVIDQSRQSTGGLGAGGASLMAQQAAQQNPEAGAYQASTTYWNAAMQMIQRGY